MPGVNVFISGTIPDTLTDLNGRFSLNVLSRDAVPVSVFAGERQILIIVK